jgi:hypothetical protein
MESHLNLSEEYRNYAENSYPSNHTFQLKNGLLVPKRELAKRHHAIKKLYPRTLTSLLDTSSSKGFFVFDAAKHPSCTRAQGIDIHDYDITFCETLKRHTHLERAHFARLTLGELANRIDEFGGPFQTVLIINCYQYLYFGSDKCSESHESHAEIFANLRKICSERIIFNNRVNLEDCQNSAQVQASPEKAEHYSKIELYAAASAYFTITEHGKIGKYPLCTMDVKQSIS